MEKNRSNDKISRTFIFAWAILLVFVLGMLTWVAIAPKPAIVITDDSPVAVELQLPEAMPVDKVILKDKETKEDLGGAASAEQLEPDIQQASHSLYENSQFGPIPHKSKNGKSCYQEYAASPVDVKEDQIRVIFIFSELGTNDDMLNNILENIPSGINLAYLPFTQDLKTKMTLARKKGHEILINLPMEPADYPNTDTGPNTLLTGLDKSLNLDRLHWVMAQGHEYVGLLNVQGSLFLASSQDLSPITEEIAKRGLMFVEAEACFRSQAYDLSAKQKLAYTKSHFVLNETLNPAELQAVLIRAEQMAQETKQITIVAHTSPLTTPVLLTWIRKAQEQNYVFLPVTQILMAAKGNQETTS